MLNLFDWDHLALINCFLSKRSPLFNILDSLEVKQLRHQCSINFYDNYGLTLFSESWTLWFEAFADYSN